MNIVYRSSAFERAIRGFDEGIFGFWGTLRRVSVCRTISRGWAGQLCRKEAAMFEPADYNGAEVNRRWRVGWLRVLLVRRFGLDVPLLKERGCRVAVARGMGSEPVATRPHHAEVMGGGSVAR